MKNSLIELRAQIDQIDKEMVSLFEQRMKVAEEVAKYKMTIGKPVLDRTRENEKIQSVKALAHTDFNQQGVESLFANLMTISRMRQYMLMAESGDVPYGFAEDEMSVSEQTKVVFAGVPGSNCQQAMHQYFGKTIDSFDVPTFKEVIVAVEHGDAEYGVLPIENSSTGIITDVYDLIAESDNCIVGEQDIKIEHALLGVKGCQLGDIQTVYSHPQGLLQCRNFLKDMHWKEMTLENTAIAARKVAQDNDKTQAAIASPLAADIYGLDILAEKINDIHNNTTRFIIIKNKKHFKKSADKISICFELPHESGSLYHVLSHFIFNGLNMSKIESRPVRGKRWQYRFFVDFDGNLSNKNVISALTGIGAETMNLHILGNYEAV